MLVVDDEPFAREAVCELLEQRGYSVEAYDDAALGLARLHAGLAPQVILLDLRMPGMDGWEFRVIQKEHPSWCEIPVIAVSADRSAKAAAIDAEAFLAKPLNERLLLETVERMVRLATQRSGRDRETELARLRDMGGMAAGMSEQLTPSINSLVDALKLAERKATELERRLDGSQAFSLRGIRQLMESAQRHGERARGVLNGVALFCQMATQSLGQRRRMLIAHSEPRLSALIAEALSDDHEVTIVRSGRDALRALIADNFDMFLCELTLPDLHGIELYEQLHEQRPEQAQRMAFITQGSFGPREREFFAHHRPWQLRAPFAASDVRELIEAQWRSFH